MASQAYAGPPAGQQPRPDYSDAPEAVRPDHSISAPEHIIHSTGDGMNEKEPGVPGPQPYPEPYPPNPQVYFAQRFNKEFAEMRPGQKRKWYRRPICITLIVLIALFLLGIGLGVGLGVGLRPSGSEDGVAGPDSEPATHSSSNSTGIVRDFDSTCSKAFCRQTLAAVYSTGQLHVFGRGNDSNIRTRIWNGTDWDPAGWTSLQGKAGPMASPPGALAWERSPGLTRIDVFAVTELDQTLAGRYYENGGWTEWVQYLGPVRSAPDFCTVTENRMDIWIVYTPTRTPQHNFWTADYNGFMIQPGWDTLIGDQVAASGVSVACRDGPSIHDAFIYDPTTSSSVKYKSFLSSTAEWTNWTDQGGSFIGDPLGRSFDSSAPDRIDFFGVGLDTQMYHFTRETVNATPSALESLGGSFIGAPSVISPAAGVMDVVAVSSTGRLLHRRFSGSSGWDGGWEDLAISANSAPLVVEANGQTMLMVLGKDAQLLVGSWATSATADWKAEAGKLADAGGTFATDYTAMYGNE